MNKYPYLTAEELAKLRGLGIEAKKLKKYIRLSPIVLLALVRGYSLYKRGDYLQNKRIRELERQVFALSTTLSLSKLEKE